MTDEQPEFSKPADLAEGWQTAPPEEPGETRNGSRWVLVTLVACLGVMVAGVSVAVFSSAGGSPASHLAGAGTSPTPVSTPTVQPTALGPSGRPAGGRETTSHETTSDGIAKSALRWPPSLKGQMQRWEAGPGGAALATVEQQLGSAAQSVGIQLYSPARQACVSLVSDVSTALAGPPIPYDPMQRLYASALTGLAHAAAHCRAAISLRADGDESLATGLNHALLHRSQAELAAASKQLYQATARIQALSR
jgi:hypothetical protein